MNAQIEEMLQAIANEKRGAGETPRPPLTLTRAEAQRLFSERMGRSCDDAYYDFCRVTNGLDWNGLMIYSIAEPEQDRHLGIVDNYLDWRDIEDLQSYLVYGDNGMDLIGQNLNTEVFELLMKPSFEVIETYDSFDEIVRSQLRQLF